MVLVKQNCLLLCHSRWILGRSSRTCHPSSDLSFSFSFSRKHQHALLCTPLFNARLLSTTITRVYKPEHEQSSHPRRWMSGWISQKWHTTPSDFVMYEAQALSRLLERAQKFRRTLYITLGVVGGVSLIFLYNWDSVKQKVGQEGAEVIREGIRSENLQLSAADFSKVLLNEMLNDEKLIGEISRWLTQLLKESKSDLALLVVQVLQSEPVLEEVRRISDTVVRHICSQSWVQEKVGELLVAAISTEYARNSAAQWTVDLLRTEAIKEQVQQVVNQFVLNEPTVREEASKLARTVVIDVLQDPKTIQSSQDHISAVLGAPEFQDYACGAAWNVLKKTFAPRWLVSPHPVSTPPSTSISQPASSKLHEAQFDESLIASALSVKAIAHIPSSPGEKPEFVKETYPVPIDQNNINVGVITEQVDSNFELLDTEQQNEQDINVGYVVGGDERSMVSSSEMTDNELRPIEASDLVDIEKNENYKYDSKNLAISTDATRAASDSPDCDNINSVSKSPKGKPESHNALCGNGTTLPQSHMNSALQDTKESLNPEFSTPITMIIPSGFNSEVISESKMSSS